MKISFRQGIIRYQSDIDNNPVFLRYNNGYVDLVVSPNPTLISLAHYDKDYLFTEYSGVDEAWGPLPTSTTVWLYWDIDIVTGIRTFGHTELEVIETAVTPLNPQVGQMWWDTVNTAMFEWNGASWNTVIRVLAGSVTGNVIQSSSINSSIDLFHGTQVGITNGNYYPGALAYDKHGAPIKSAYKNQFFTTEDVFTTGVPTGASLKVGNMLIKVQAQQPIAAYSVVEYYDFGKIGPASPSDSMTKLYGIVEEDAFTNDVVSFITDGVIHNEHWDWITAGANVNDVVYINNTGQLTTISSIPNQLPMGTVIGAREILFRPGLNSTVGNVSSGTMMHGSMYGLTNDDHPQYLTEDRGDTRYYNQEAVYTLIETRSPVDHVHSESSIEGLDKYTQDEIAVLLADKALVGHSHTEVDVVGLDKYTTQEVDTFLADKIGIDGSTLTGPLILHADPVDSAEAATKQYVDIGDSRKSDLGHTHAEFDILDLDKYTQAQVDGLLADKLDTAGGTVGQLTLSASPVNPMDAATKQYVDSVITTHPYDINIQMIGLHSEQVVGIYGVVRNFTVNASAPSAVTYAITPGSTIETEIEIRRNGQLIGSINFPIGDNSGLITWNTQINFVVDDIITFETATSGSGGSPIIPLFDALDDDISGVICSLKGYTYDI